MASYVEIFVNVDFEKNVPDYVIDVIRAVCCVDVISDLLDDKPDSWPTLFRSSSAYTPNTQCGQLTYCKAFERWSLLAKGDTVIMTDIVDFFEFIKPYVKDEFMGYFRDENYEEPVLVYKSKQIELHKEPKSIFGGVL